MNEPKPRGNPRWVKGCPSPNPNPSGPPKDLVQIRKLNAADLERMLNKFAQMPFSELSKFTIKEGTKDQPTDSPSMECMIARIFHKAILEGDPRRMDFILDRTIGKLPIKVEDVGKTLNQQIVDMVIAYKASS